MDTVANEHDSGDAEKGRFQLKQRLQALAASPRLPLYLALLSALLVSPSLATGLQLDDYFHRFCAVGAKNSEALCPTRVSLFTIAPGNPVLTHRAIEYGMLPFWTYDALQVKFMRPLASLTHFIDYNVFPNSPALMHAESIAWFAAAIFLAARYYRAIMGGAAATAAAFAFAVDHIHGIPAGWVGNRNAVMAACFGTAALLVYERSTRHPSARTTLLGAGCLLLGFLSGEVALGAWAYLLAHALVLDERPKRARVAGLLPYAVVTVAWRVVYSLMGFGATGSALYIDPGREPLQFLRVLPTRLPWLVQGLFGLPPAETAYFTTPLVARAGLVGAILFTLAVIVAFSKMTRVDRVARFWAVGCAFSLLAACSAVPHNRLLYFASLGGMGLLAIAVDAFTKKDWRLPTGITRKVSQLVVVLCGGLHAFVSPLLLPFAACTMAVMNTIADRNIPSAIATMTDVPHQELVIVSAPEFYSGYSLRYMRDATGEPQPEKLRVLSVGAIAMRARRVDAHTLELTYENGLLADPALRLFRDDRHPMKPGDSIALDGLQIVIQSVTSDGRPAVVTFTFAEPLDSPKLRWVIWQKDRFVRFTPPENDGEAVDITPARREYVIG
jgi:hypothetical protein